MSSVFYRAPGQAYPRAVRGEGVYLWDADGQKYLDGSGGAAISCLGHGHAGVISAVRRQAGDMAFAHTQFFTNEPQEQLAVRLAELCPIPDARVYFLSGGSEANETALKLVRQYWRSAGEHDRHIVITRRQSYHGNTLGALSVTGHTKRRAPYEPMLHQWPRVSPCNAYRDQLPNETTARPRPLTSTPRCWKNLWSSVATMACHAGAATSLSRTDCDDSVATTRPHTS